MFRASSSTDDVEDKTAAGFSFLCWLMNILNNISFLLELSDLKEYTAGGNNTEHIPKISFPRKFAITSFQK